MAVLEGDALRDDPWQVIADDAPLASDGPIIVGVRRLLAEPETVLAHAGPLGVALLPDTDVALLQPSLERLAIIVVAFAKYRDGRGFTQARALREYWGYRGEIRAQGHLVPDQYAYLLRCGFSSVELPAAHADPAIWVAAARSVTIAYQPGLTSEEPLAAFRRRLRE